MIKSADAVAQETNPVEFGPKLTSKFFAFFPLAAPPSQGRADDRASGPLVPKRVAADLHSETGRRPR